eukprot:1178377-Prorocentrum_minimum.AAC.1
MTELGKVAPPVLVIVDYLGGFCRGRTFWVDPPYEWTITDRTARTEGSPKMSAPATVNEERSGYFMGETRPDNR